ncbi:hypothetical protein JR065_00505 [Xanthomonas sp. AmX2]|uniref:hypothetical protein n=1 Tax=Xanthomonas sp. TaxID=29446 RepID=UPI00198072B1|nr:hypothetical protein [Xanthomonas sp.]MBN6148806.1 hypothetical protein [Xanthomonas sp.]
MSAEFIVFFEDKAWYPTHLQEMRQKIAGLGTCSRCIGEAEFRLTGNEPRDPDTWDYDVRLFLEKERIFLEISAHPPSIEADLSAFFRWIRSRTEISIADEDGVPAGW